MNSDNRNYLWRPTAEQDSAPAPPWAAEVGAQSLRVGPAAALYSQISAREVGPTLVCRKTRSMPRHPVYIISFSTWSEVCDLYPGMRPSMDEIGTVFTSKDLPPRLAREVFIPAVERGVHSFAHSLAMRDPWYVAFVPRLWWESVYLRLRRDRRLDLLEW